MNTHHDLWTLQLQRCPDMLAWPKGKDGIRRCPETGEPCLVVEGWEHSRFDKWSVHEVQDDGDRRTRFDLSTTESHAANWLAYEWAKWAWVRYEQWLLFNYTDTHMQPHGSRVQELLRLATKDSGTTPPQLLTAVAACLREMGDSDD